MNIFDYVNSVSSNKENLFDGNDKFEEEYSPYIINKALSMYPDTILHANMMNQYPNLPKELQYKYYLHGIRAKKRFSKWHKAIVDEDLKYIRRFFKVSYQKAKECKATLTEQQVEKIVAYEKAQEEIENV